MVYFVFGGVVKEFIVYGFLRFGECCEGYFVGFV